MAKIYMIEEKVKELTKDLNTDTVTWSSHMASDREVAIFVGTKGVVISDYEGIHYVLKDVDDTYVVDASSSTKKIQEDGSVQSSIAFMAEKSFEGTVSEWMDGVTVKEVPFVDFLKGKGNYNSRISNNVSLLLKSLKKIGHKNKMEVL